MDTRRPPTRIALAVAFGVAVLGVLWFLSDARAARVAHDEALDRWDEREPAAYTFVYGHCSGMCASCPVRITVRDGAVTEAVVSGKGCAQVDEQAAPTIEHVFAVAERHRPGLFGDSSSITYDPHWGFPSHISVTCGPDTADCGSAWSVSDFEDLVPRD